MSRIGRAVVYPAPNAPFEMRHYPVRDVHAGEVLVRITMSTICRSDIHSYEGRRSNPFPGILGHEIIGVIEQMGECVGNDLHGDSLAPGDRVTWTEFFTDGPSYYRDVLDMPQEAPGLRKYGHDHVDDEPHFLGGFADYCYIQPGTGILKLPDEITDEEATPLNCGIATMIAATEAADISVGETVVVQGLGLLGIYGCAIAKSRGAARIIGLDKNCSRRRKARLFGADLTFDVETMSDDELVVAVRDASPPDGPDVVLEVCGVSSVIPGGVRMLRIGGRYVLAGLINPGSTFELDGSELVHKWITLKGIHNYHPRHLVQALDFVMANRDRYPFAEIVDARFKLDQLDTAFEMAANHRVLRAAIVP